MAKPNYKHAKKQKEAARKARQDAKQQRKAGAPEPGGVAPGELGAASERGVPATLDSPASVPVKSEA